MKTKLSFTHSLQKGLIPAENKYLNNHRNNVIEGNLSKLKDDDDLGRHGMHRCLVRLYTRIHGMA